MNTRQCTNSASLRHTKTLAFCGLFTALIFVFTYLIKLPSPGMGYVHAGDAFIILSAILLGPFAGFMSAAFGSVLADLIGGYLIFAPATFLIKGVEAVLAYVLFSCFLKILRSESRLKNFICLFFAAVPSAAFMVIAYLGYEIAIFDTAVALASVWSNVGQGLVSVILALICYAPLAAALNGSGVRT